MSDLKDMAHKEFEKIREQAKPLAEELKKTAGEKKEIP